MEETPAEEVKPVAEEHETPENEDIKLNFKTLTGDAFSLSLPKSTTVLELKEAVHQIREVPLTCMKFMAGRKMMGPDTKTLEDLGLKDEDKIRMIVRLMNFITPANMIGEWFWTSSCTDRTSFKVTEDMMWIQKGCEASPHCLSIDAEKGFGFSNEHGGNIWLLLKPEKVTYSGCIKTTHGHNNSSVIFWSRKCDATLRDEMIKAYGGCNIEIDE